MPPRAKKNKGNEHEESADKGESKGEAKKGGEKFGCVCGKTYGSLAAVHTHINNKHK